MESGRKRKAKVIWRIRLALVVSLFACQTSDQRAAIATASPIPKLADTAYIASGDLILRMGNSFYSPIARNISTRERRFSHVGIASLECGAVFIIHAEADDSGEGGVRIDPVSDFLLQANDWGIYRLRATESERLAVARMAESYLAQAIPFDLNFDAADSTAFYCSELVMHCINRGLGCALVQPATLIKDRYFVAIDETYLNDQTFRVR